MRSSKNRSRNKQNRPRSLGNIINRVFDSSGPEGKVRGTPQQIIEKYQMLARDAQLSNDRVAAENFLQHAEHYTRLLAEAQREMAAEQEARQQSQGLNGGRERGEWRQDRDYRPEADEDAGFAQGTDAFALVDGDEQPIVDFPAPQARREDRPQGERRRDDRPQERRRDDRPRDDRPRDDRPREDRPRDDRPREDRPREDRPREDRPREDRRRDRAEPRQIEIVSAQQPSAPQPVAPQPQPELPAFITGQPTPASSDAAPTEAPAKPRRAPRKPKVEDSAE